MRLSGLYSSFGRAVRPRALSFFVRVERECAVRSAFNIVLSSRPEAYHERRLYYPRTRLGHPDPADLFVFVLNTQTVATARGTYYPASLCLPSGETLYLKLPPLALGAWHQVRIEFDWTGMKLTCHVDGRTLQSVGFLASQTTASFGPHVNLGTNELENQVADEILAGFQHMYSFTWLATDVVAEKAPEVWLGDVWMEGEEPVTCARRRPRGAALTAPIAADHDADTLADLLGDD